MMKKITALLVLIFITLLTITSGYCQDEKVKIYFCNGILNKEDDATKSLAALIILFNKANIIGDLEGKISCKLAYNPSDGILDLYEAVVQTADIAWTSFWRFLAGVDPMPDFIQDRMKIISAKFDEDMVKSYTSIQDHIKIYNEDLCQGNKVIVVAHSQGNLYANIAYTKINENVKDGFGIVSVANPSWYVAGDSSDSFYTTIEEDLVIGILPVALPSTTDNFDGFNPNDLSGHMFTASYLAPGHRAESRILDHIITKIYTLEWPEGPCEKEYIIIRARMAEGINWLPYTGGATWYYFVFDPALNGYAIDVPLNDGETMATFPCVEEEINGWLEATKEKTIAKPLYKIFQPGYPQIQSFYTDTNPTKWYPDCRWDQNCDASVVVEKAVGPQGETGLINECNYEIISTSCGEDYFCDSWIHTINYQAEPRSYYNIQINTGSKVGIPRSNLKVTKYDYYKGLPWIDTYYDENREVNWIMSVEGPFGPRLELDLSYYNNIHRESGTDQNSPIIKSGSYFEKLAFPPTGSLLKGFPFQSDEYGGAGHCIGFYGKHTVAQILILGLAAKEIDFETNEILGFENNQYLGGAINIIEDELLAPFFDPLASTENASFSRCLNDLAAEVLPENRGVFFEIDIRECPY
jgi:hypothetical protein